MNKIYKLSNGEFITVDPKDENNFLKELEIKKITADLVVDETTLNDVVPSAYSAIEGLSINTPNTDELIDSKGGTSANNPTVSPPSPVSTDTINVQTSSVTPNNTELDAPAPDIKDYTLGTGGDFAASIPNEIITLKNGFDYFSLRSEATSFNKNYSADDLAKMQEQHEFYDDRQVEMFDLYSQNSGYIPLYGNMNTWDEQAHARNKEVKDAIFSGKYGYNPATDKLFLLDEPISVELYDQVKAYEQNSSFETYDDYAKGLSLKGKTPYKLDPSGSDLFMTEKEFVDSIGKDMFAYGFTMEQSGEYTGDQQVTIVAMNGKKHKLNLNPSSESEIQKELNAYNKFVQENYVPGEHYKYYEPGKELDKAKVETYGEMFLEQVRPDEEVLTNWANDFNSSLDLIDGVRKAFGLEGYTDAQVLSYYTHFKRYSVYTGQYDTEPSLYYDEPGTYAGEKGIHQKNVELFGETFFDMSVERYDRLVQRLSDQGIELEDLDNWYLDEDIVGISKHGRDYDEQVAIGYYIQHYEAVTIDGETIQLTQENIDKIGVEKIADAITATDEYKEVVETLLTLDSHNKAKKDYIQEQVRKTKWLGSLEGVSEDEVEFMSDNFWSKSELQTYTYRDMNFDRQNMDKAIADLAIEIDVIQDNLKGLRERAKELEDELTELGVNPNEVFDDIADKYNIKYLEDWQSNEKAQAEWDAYRKIYSEKWNEFTLLTQETIPVSEDLLNKKYEDLDSSNFTKAEMMICLDVLNRNSEPGKYWTYQASKAIYRTLFGGASALGAGITDIWLEVWGEITGGGPEDKNIPLYNIIKPTNEWFVELNDSVQDNIEYQDARHSKRTTFGDIDGFSSAMDYLLGGAIDTSVILAMAMISKNPKVVGAIIGTYGGSEKYNELRRERDLFRDTDGAYGQDFNVFEMLFNGVITGTAEAYSERFTIGQWRNLNYFAKNEAAKLGFEQAIYKNIWTPKNMAKFLAYHGTQFTEEGLTEVLAQFSSNTVDVWIGKEGADYWDGIDEAFINGAFISTLMHAPSMFKQGVLDPWIGADTNQKIAEIYAKVQNIIENESLTRFGKRYDELTKEEREPIDEMVFRQTAEIEELLTKDLYKVDLLTPEQKRELIEINKLDFEARKKAREITSDPRLNAKEIAEQQLKLREEVDARAKRKREILAEVNPEAAEKLYRENMGIVKDTLELSEEMGAPETEIIDVNTDEYSDIVAEDTQNKTKEQVEDIVAESEGTQESMEEVIIEANDNINKAETKINESEKIIEETKKEVEVIEKEISNQVDEITKIKQNDNISKKEQKNQIDKKEKIIEDQTKKKNEKETIIQKENSKLDEQTTIIKNEKENKKEAENLIDSKSRIETNLRVGTNILKPNSYGMMRPIFDKKGNIKKLQIVVNKDKAIKDGAWATAAHELVHAVFANTIKSDPAMRLKLGGAMAEILNSGKLQFKDARAADLFNRRVASYSIDKQGEEALAIVSEMLVKGEVTLKESTLGKLGSMFRRWSMQRYSKTFQFNNSNDILNFIKDYHYSIKNNKPSEAIARLLAKGANGKMFEGAKTPADRKNLNMHSLAVNKAVKSNPDLRSEFDDLVKNKDGSKKHENNEDFKASPEYIEGYNKIVDSKLLDGLIQVGMTERGLPPDALKDFTRKVKEEIGIRYLNNYNLDKNDSLFGWLAGTAGGAGKSIIYRAKGDVINQYLKEEAKISIDKTKDETGKIADTIQADKDAVIDKIEEADLSPEAMKESIQDVKDLTMVMEMLGFPENVRNAVKEAVRSANIPLEGLTYKGIRDLLLSMDGKATSEKNVVPNGPLFEVLNAISTEFGVDPLRILAKQDLNAEQRKAAQEYIFTKSVNEDGSFNTSFLDALPEGQDRDGRATGVANTKLGEFYTKGDRLKVREGAKKDLGQKFAQDKRTDVTKEEFLNLFGINPDGTFQPGTKADGAIRELIVQVSQLAANQEMRLNAIENRIEASENIARLKDGTSEAMFSFEAKENSEYSKEKFNQDPKDRHRAVPKIPAQKKGKDKFLKSKIVDYDAPSPWNSNITMKEELLSTTKSFLTQYPELYDQLRNTMCGGIGLSTFFTKPQFEEYFPPKKYRGKNQKSISRNSYVIKSKDKGKNRRFNSNTLNKKDDSRQRLSILYDFAKAMEGYLKTNKNPNPQHLYLFTLMASDTVNNQSGAITRILSPWSFYTLTKNGAADLINIMVEEHAGPQKGIMNLLVNAAYDGKIDDVWPIVEAVYAQGTLLETIDNRLSEVKNKDGKSLKENLPDIFWDSIAERILDGKLDDLPQGIVAMVRYFVAGKELNIDIINTIKWKNNKTLAENFGVKIDAEISPAIFQFQYDLVLDYLSGNITKEVVAEAINKLNVEGINAIESIKETMLTKNKLVENSLNIATMLSKEVEVKGMSTFDFDDTLARTKSGVRYTMPNNTGAPAPGRKVIFLAGSAGSGKSNVVKQLGLEDQGFKVVNQDIALEWLVKNSGLPTDMRDFTSEQASKWGSLQWEARDIAQRKATKFRGRGDGVVVDGTGASTISLFTQAQKYKDAGYDVQMLFVDSSLDVALSRNQARKERSLKDFIVERNWKAVQKNKKAFKEEFGDNFVEVNTDNLKQGDPMPTDLVVKINNFTGGYIKGRLTAEEFANKGGALLEQGAVFDFSEFNKVVDGTPGPLLDKARKRAKKFGTKDMFVLTARPQQSAFAIQQFLKGQGLDIPIKNITGLANSSGQAKAQWMLDKFAEGYNDMYFVDDALQNVEAVKSVLDQLDIKSKVVQAKLKENGKLVEPGNDTMYSKVVEPDIDIDIEFNEMIERKKGVDANKRFSSAEARKRGAKWRPRLYIPPSAEDFKGLLYYFLGKGKQGDADLRFFERVLLKPFAEGIRAWNTYKQNMVNEYSDLKKKFPGVNKNINKKVPGTSFTNDTAIRVYLWSKAGFDIPGISKTLQQKLVAHVINDPNLTAFAEGLSLITRRKDGYIPPGRNWVMESIPTDLRNVVDKVGRREFLQNWIDNKNIIFSQENLNKIEALYGTTFRDALEDILYRMEYGGNRKRGNNKFVNNFTDWINGSVGAIMFVNMRSALLQTMSIVNFINWSDNNVFKASAAFANQPQFWKDFVMLFNSPQLKQRRKGLQTDVSAAELTKSFRERGYSPATVISYLLQKGFLPTQIADSFAIAFGGASFYRNRYNKYIKQGLTPKQAHDKTMLEFQEIAEETQQSSREDMISPEQASVLGRLVLAFQNVTMQYGRLNKKALSDLINRRGDMKTNVSKIIFYGMVNNIIFSALQNALAFMIWGGDEEEIDDKVTRTFNSALDSFLRGTGLYGAFISTLKNTIIQWDIQSKKPYGQDKPEKIILEVINLSPPIGSKVRKITNAYYAEKYNEGLSAELGLRIENPTLQKWANIIEAVTNVPLARLLNKANNLEEAITGQHELWKRIAMFLGWNRWDVGVEDEEIVEAEERLDKKKEIEKEKEKEEKKKEKEKEKEEEKKKEEEEKKKKGIKTVRCSGTKSNGDRCKLTTETADKSWKCPHHMNFTDGMDRDGDGVKEYRCTFIKKNGEQCKMKGEYGKKKRCYHHD